MDEIKVVVVKYPDRENLVMRYVDPMTGRQKSKSSGTTSKKEADKRAAKWEAELIEGRYKAPKKMTWEAFREKYENEVLPSLAINTRKKADAVFNVLESIISPGKLAELTAGRLSYWQSELRKAKKSESTIKSHMSTLKAALYWAVRVGVLNAVPKMDMPKRAKGSKVMKGRAITGEEFERMIAKVAGVVGDTATASWEFYLNGLWLSGLRLAESLTLSWDEEATFRVDFSGKRPMLVIPAEGEKGNEDRILPIAPEFARWLQTVPEGERTGFVFKPLPRWKQHVGRLGEQNVRKIIAAIGKAAGVVVNHAPKKFATAHDLRRSFGQRWASKVMPQVLMVLMRHENIETTNRYYVGRDAESTADVLWATEGNILGNNAQNESQARISVSNAKDNGNSV